MKTQSVIKHAILFFILILITNSTMAQVDSAKSVQWVTGKSWDKGLDVNVNPSVNSVEFERQYEANKATWDKVFQFLGDSAKLATLAPGKYPIDGENAYASITEAPSKTTETAKWESHRKYIDLQYVIKGEEKIELAPLSTVTVTEPYLEAKDAAHYSGNGTYYVATPKEFFLFFPLDVHRPNIKVDGYDVVKKLVIKIKYVQ